MTFKKTEKEIIKAIVKYDGKAKSLAEVFNKSQLLEKKGIGIVQYGGKNMVFLRKDLYDDWFHNDGLGYIAELLSLIDTLIKQKYLVMIPFCTEETLVIGAQESRWLKPEVILVNGNEYICVADRMENWFSATREQKYWPCAYSERELRELVKHNFKSEEEVRFIKQQRLTWISIAVAAAIGLLGIIF